MNIIHIMYNYVRMKKIQFNKNKKFNIKNLFTDIYSGPGKGPALLFITVFLPGTT